MNELLPCPFCGSTNVQVETQRDIEGHMTTTGTYNVIQCYGECGLTITDYSDYDAPDRRTTRENIERLAALWNKRSEVK